MMKESSRGRVRGNRHQTPASVGLLRASVCLLLVVGTLTLQLAAAANPASAVVSPGDTVTTSLDQYMPISPARLLDSRPGSATVDSQFAGGGVVGAGGVLELSVLGRGGVPASGVGAVVLNVTVTAPTAASFVTVWPTGEARPNASNLNMAAGQTVPNLVIAKVGAGGKVSLANEAGSTHLIADVTGWFPVVEGVPDPSTIVVAGAGEATIISDAKAAQPIVAYTGPRSVHVGDIIVIPPGAGSDQPFYGRIIGGAAGGYLTTPLLLADIFPSANFDVQVAGGSGGLLVRSTNIPISVASDEVGLTQMAASAEGLRVAKPTLECQSSVSGLVKNLSLEGTGPFVRNTNVSVDWKRRLSVPVGVNSVSISAEVGMTLAVSSSLSGSASCSARIRLIDMTKGEIPQVKFLLAGIPIVITQDVTVDLRGRIQATGAVSLQYKKDFGARLGAKYENGRFSPISDALESPANSASLDASASATVEFSLPISYDGRLYGAVGLGATLEPTLTGTATVNATTSTVTGSAAFDLAVPLSIRGTVKLASIWSKEFEFAKFMLFQKRLWDRTWSIPRTAANTPPPDPVAAKPPAVPNPVPTGGVDYRIAHTGGIGVRIRNSARLADAPRTGPGEGATVTILCQTWGDAAGDYSNHVWDQIRWGSQVGYIPDAYTDTPTATDQFLAGVTMCPDPGPDPTGAPSSATTNVYRAANTGGIGVSLRDGVSLSSGRRTGPAEGDSFQILCQSWGDPVGNFANHIWDEISWNGQQGFIPDAYSSTPADADQFMPNISRCSGGAPPVDSTPAQPQGTTYSYTVVAGSYGGVNARSGPGTTFPIVSFFGNGTGVVIVCKTNGETVFGTPIWNRTNQGSYITDAGLDTPTPSPVPVCGTPISGGGGGPTTYAYQITTTDVPLQTCAGPRPGCATIRYFASGDTINVICQAVGGGYYVGNGGTTAPIFTMWDKVAEGWVPDAWVNTPNTNAFSPPIPNC
jgi:hypothetical protein